MSKAINRRKRRGYKRWLWFFLILAVLVHVGVFYLFKLDLLDPPPTSKRAGFVYYLPEKLPAASQELEQRAFLFDSEPIFLPTTRNYSGPIKTDASVWEPEVSLLSAFPAEIRWDDSLLIMEPNDVKGSDSPLEFLQAVSRDFVSEFGAEVRPPVAAHKPGLYVEAKTAEGHLFLKTFIELDKELNMEFPLKSLLPEFSVYLTEFGVAGDPLLVRPSGSDDLDDFVREFVVEMVQPLLLGSSGYFHIRIGL